MALSPTARLVTTAFLVSGTVHLARPKTFKPLMPRWVPAHREVIIGRAAPAYACAAGLLLPPTRRIAAYAGAALLVGVFPGNVKMALDSAGSPSPAYRAAVYGRLPLQVPMVLSMLRTARRR